MTALVDESIVLPCLEEWSHRDLSLTRTIDGVTEIITESITLESNKMKLPASPIEATYKLTILPINQQVNVTVRRCRKVYEDDVETNYFD